MRRRFATLLLVLAATYAVAALAWLAINPDQRVESA